MKKTTEHETGQALAVNAESLAAMLGCGRATAVKIGVEAGARFTVGRRTLYTVDKVKSYIETIAEEG